ncbi:peptidase inhibitor family I36 protein [Streptomyces sp. NPDC048361]|uniref:peptidase inhibitor family I36 protein n=1 Tax=Streptomyces sp. NPDC048361 TaxID=3154720 RepID=UPI003417D2F0
MKLRTWSLACALSLTALLVPVSDVAAAPAAPAAPSCTKGSICFYTGSRFDGRSWEWVAKDGYHDMPAEFHDHVGSFVSSAEGCFINWDPKETRVVHSGDSRIDYVSDFGGRIDGVGQVC